MDEKSLRVALHNMLLYDDLGRALEALGPAGVDVIVLKGMALASSVYPSIADRPMNDIDLLVGPEQRQCAQRALEAAGYAFMPEPRKRFSPFDTEFTGEMQFRRTRHNVLELHWELTPSDWLRRLIALNTDELWADARPFSDGAATALQLSPCDTLLHLCLHLSAHAYVHDNGFRDIEQLLAHLQPFPWGEFVARARRRKMAAMCYFVLDAAAGPVPPGVLDSLRPPAWQQRLVRAIVDPRQGKAGRLRVSPRAGYLLHLALADRLADVIRTLAWLFFPGPRWLAERYRLAGPVRPRLACLWHPLVVAWQGAAGLSAVLARGH